MIELDRHARRQVLLRTHDPRRQSQRSQHAFDVRSRQLQILGECLYCFLKSSHSPILSPVLLAQLLLVRSHLPIPTTLRVRCFVVAVREAGPAARETPASSAFRTFHPFSSRAAPSVGFTFCCWNHSMSGRETETAIPRDPPTFRSRLPSGIALAVCPKLRRVIEVAATSGRCAFAAVAVEIHAIPFDDHPSSPPSVVSRRFQAAMASSRFEQCGDEAPHPPRLLEQTTRNLCVLVP